MNKTIFNYILMSVILLAAQAVIFNNLVLFNCAMPFVFVYMIIAMPITIGPNVAMTVGFLAGLFVDAVSDTYGLNTLSCTVLSFVRRPIFHLYVSRDEDLSGQRPSMRTMGVETFMKYSLTMVLIYCTLAFIIESFGFFDFWLLLLRIVASTVYTFVLIYAIDSLTLSQREKKL